MTESPNILTAEEARPLNLQLYAGLLRKNFILILAVWLGIFIAGFIYVNSLPRIYSATSSVILQQSVGARALQGLTDFSSPGSLGQTGAPTSVAGLSLETAARLVATSLRAKKTAEKINEEVGRRTDLRVSTGEVVGSLNVRAIPPDEIRIEARSTVPVKAMLIANHSSEVFVEETKFDANQNARSAVKFLNDMLKDQRKEMDQAEDELAQLRKKELIFDLPEEAKKQTERLAVLEADGRMLQASLEMTRRRIDSLKARVKSESTTEKLKGIAQDPIVKSLREQLMLAEMDAMKARTKYTDDHPQAIIAKRQVEQLQQRLAKEASRTIDTEEYVANPVYRAARELMMQEELKLIDLESRGAATNSLIAEARTKMGQLPDRQRQFQRLLRRVEIASRIYNTLLAKHQDALLNERVANDSQGTARVVDNAGRPTVPILPKVSQTLVFAALLGLMAGVMVAFVRESLDTSLHTPEDVTRHLGIPCLGFVPRLQMQTNGRSGLILIEDPRSPAAESYRTLRSNLKYANLDHPDRILLVTSAIAGEGKSMTVANLAISLAESGKRVLVIDSDLRRPTQHLLFDVDNDIGLTSILVRDVGVERAVRKTKTENLELLTSGPIPPNPAELLDSDRYAEFIKTVGGQYDYVILDSPPALIVTDAMVLAGSADGTLLVCEAESVNRNAAHRVIELIERARGKTLGVILNKIRFTRGGYYYYYPYYYYYYGRRN